jgi:hypothetical protein
MNRRDSKPHGVPFLFWYRIKLKLGDRNMKTEKSEFRFRGKNLGIEKLKILVLAYDDIEDYDIVYMIVDSSGGLVDTTDCAKCALDIVLEGADEALSAEIKKPWHIQIVWSNTYKDISKSRFRKLFGDALLLEYKKDRADT